MDDFVGQVGQLVVSNANLAQQLATGKAQLATINGQQVLIRTAQSGAAVGSNMVLKTTQQQPQTAVKVIKSPTTSTAVGGPSNQASPTKVGQTTPAKLLTSPTKSTTVTSSASATNSAASATNVIQVSRATFVYACASFLYFLSFLFWLVILNF